MPATQTSTATGTTTREDELRQVAAEVGLEPVAAARGRGRDLAGVGAVERERLVTQALLDEREPQLREHAGRRAAPGDLEAPAERSSRRERRDEQRRAPARQSASGAPWNARATIHASSAACTIVSSAAPTPSAASAASSTRTGRARRRRRGSSPFTRRSAAPRAAPAPVRLSRGRARRRSTRARKTWYVQPWYSRIERQEDQRDDAHHRERVVGRRGVVDGEAVREAGARDHHPRVEAREERRDVQSTAASRRRRERETAAAPVGEDDGEHECGDPERRRQHRREDVLVVLVGRDDDRPGQERPRRRAAAASESRRAARAARSHSVAGRADASGTSRRGRRTGARSSTPPSDACRR